MSLTKCSKCGAMFSSQVAACPKCGQPAGAPCNNTTVEPSQDTLQYQPVNPQPTYVPQTTTIIPQQPKQPSQNNSNAEDKPSIGLNVLSFLSPLIGWIIYFCVKKTKPLRASSCAKWAWISFGINMLVTIIASAVA